MPLQLVLVVYFGSGLSELSGLELLEGSEICYCQYWKRVLVLVDFQDKLSIV